MGKALEDYRGPHIFCECGRRDCPHCFGPTRVDAEGSGMRGYPVTGRFPVGSRVTVVGAPGSPLAGKRGTVVCLDEREYWPVIVEMDEPFHDPSDRDAESREALLAEHELADAPVENAEVGQ